MTRPRPLAALLALVAAFASAPALAGEGPYIELTVSAEQTMNTPSSRALARWVFDASAPPVSSDATRIVFEPVSCDLTISSASSPLTVPSQTVTSDDPIASFTAKLTVFRLTQNYRLEIEAVDAAINQSIEVNIDALPAFGPSITSLPDDPADYRPLDTMDASYSDGGVLDDFMAWNHELGFVNGRMFYRALEVEPGTPTPGCNEADLAPPFGTLDFSDVIAYLTAFGAGCP